MRNGWVSFGIGMVGGAAVGGLIWYFADKALDRSLSQGSAQLAADLGMGEEELRRQLAAGRDQMRSQLTAQIQSQVPAEIDRRLAAYGIDRNLVRRAQQVVDYAERARLI